MLGREGGGGGVLLVGVEKEEEREGGARAGRKDGVEWTLVYHH